MIGPLYVLYQTRHFREKHLYSYSSDGAFGYDQARLAQVA